MRIVHLLFLALFVAIFFSCNKDDENPSDCGITGEYCIWLESSNVSECGPMKIEFRSDGTYWFGTIHQSDWQTNADCSKIEFTGPGQSQVFQEWEIISFDGEFLDTDFLGLLRKQ